MDNLDKQYQILVTTYENDMNNNLNDIRKMDHRIYYNAFYDDDIGWHHETTDPEAEIILQKTALYAIRRMKQFSSDIKKLICEQPNLEEIVYLFSRRSYLFEKYYDYMDDEIKEIMKTALIIFK